MTDVDVMRQYCTCADLLAGRGWVGYLNGSHHVRPGKPSAWQWSTSSLKTTVTAPMKVS